VACVYLLGAGFSRAISNHMPLMSELSKAVDEKLAGRNIPGAGTPVASDFERWLSYLIERPPWLGTAEQERNRAAFLDVSNAVHAILARRQATPLHHKTAWIRPVGPLGGGNHERA
jgi:hypothetical protein